MIKLKKKYVIGTHVMWFEIEMFKDFIDGLINLMDTVENKENVDIDLCFNLNQKLEKIDEDRIDEKELMSKFSNEVQRLQDVHPKLIGEFVMNLTETNFIFTLTIGEI